MKPRARDTSLSRETFALHYSSILKGQRLPMIYLRQRHSAVVDTGLHLHEDHYSLYLTHSGRGIHHIDGHPYAVMRGDVYLTPPGTVHAYYDSENLSADVIVFTIDLFRDEEINALRAQPGFRGLLVAGSDWNAHRLQLSPKDWEDAKTQMQAINDELIRARQEYSDENQTPTANEILARMLFFRLLITLARLWSTESTSHQEPNTEYRQVELADVLRFCNENFDKPLTVPQLAAQMFLSPSHFAEIFKREMGVPPGQYLRRLRLDHAQIFLKTTNDSATVIARKCGFSDGAQFSRAFREAFGISPSEYRKRFRR